MTDSPAFRTALDPQEQPMLDSLLVTRDKLLLLKADKSKYVKSQDVLTLYDQVLVQIGALNDIRATKPREQNILDKVLDDCLQLISLFFLTIGRNAEAPAAYSVASTIKRLLDHLKEAGFFSGKDLTSISHQLDKITESVERGQSNHNSHILTLLQNRVANCKVTLTELRQDLSLLPPELESTHEKLVSILRTLSGLNLKPKLPVAEVKEYQKQLREIEAGLEGHPQALPPSDGRSAEEQYADRLRHMYQDEHHTLPGKELVVDLLGRVLLWSEIMLHRQGRVDDRFKETFTSLLDIHKQLEKLSLTQAWSLRETDLYGYQRRLDKVDESRVDGNFLDAEGKPADVFEQRALLYLLRKCYATIYFMITSSEPVSEALAPIYNQLTTLRRCLIEVKRSGGVSSARELYPYSMKLNSIDNMRQDGKFIVNGDIPEGQGSVTALLSECFELAYELRNDAEREDENTDEEDDGDDNDADGTDKTRRHRDLDGDGGHVEGEDESIARIPPKHSLISGSAGSGPNDAVNMVGGLTLGVN